MSDFWSWVRKWWPGLIPLAILWAAAVWTSTLPVENDIGWQIAERLGGPFDLGNTWQEAQ